MAQFKILFCLTVIFVLFAIAVGQANYCSICRDHTMCKPHYTKPNCRTQQYGLTAEQRNKIVSEHNRYRQLVASGNEKRGSPRGPQPKAKSMPNMVWDNEIANIAQTQANSCIYAHDSCRNVQRFQVGQNIAQWPVAKGRPPQKVEALVKLWYDEVEKFNPAMVENFVFEAKTGHYTQMLWAQTTRIGCGYVNYEKNGQYNVYLVCNYGPSGNVRGGKVYEIRR
ncbi:venom allergen 5-like [Leptopilina heterotoma]|uniref:venom allergen 5-like n=1 Tax=Leptopilina heterotoma TaxID=63436 RepID=UPI001CA8B9B0|nr:venom allergen 5-like [Leptopilina heterotoma]XP_043468732.1 venom allergen 5-like [Leptopilina heterotoma]